MEEGSPDPFIQELVYQVKARRKMVHDRIIEYGSDDPVTSLPLTDYLRGLLEGRKETWEFIEKMIPDIVTRVEERLKSEDLKKENQSMFNAS